MCVRAHQYYEQAFMLRKQLNERYRVVQLYHEPPMALARPSAAAAWVVAPGGNGGERRRADSVATTAEASDRGTATPVPKVRADTSYSPRQSCSLTQ